MVGVHPATLRRALNGPDDLRGSLRHGERVRPLCGPGGGRDMDVELISTEEYDSLPAEDGEQCFVEFEAICRRNMTWAITEDTSSNFDRSVQAQ